MVLFSDLQKVAGHDTRRILQPNCRVSERDILPLFLMSNHPPPSSLLQSSEDDGTDDVPRDPSQLYTLFEILGHQVRSPAGVCGGRCPLPHLLPSCRPCLETPLSRAPTPVPVRLFVQVPIDVVDLDLRGHTLATLPVDLRRRAQLRTLNLSYNRLSVGTSVVDPAKPAE